MSNTENKTVTTNELYAEIYAMREAFQLQTGTNGEIEFYEGSGRGEKIHITITLQKNVMNTETTLDMAEKLKIAAEFAKNFKYNGYLIPYSFEW